MGTYDYNYDPGEVAQTFNRLSALHREGNRDPTSLKLLTEEAVGNFVVRLRVLVMEDDLVSSLRFWADELENPSFKELSQARAEPRGGILGGRHFR